MLLLFMVHQDVAFWTDCHHVEGWLRLHAKPSRECSLTAMSPLCSMMWYFVPRLLRPDIMR